MYVDHFGYIPDRLDLIWPGGQLRTVEDFDASVQWFDRHVHPNEHYLYPPTVHTRTGWPEQDAVKVPGTDRPALLHRLPVTHEIHLHNISGSQREVRLSTGGLAIHWLGFVLGRRCHFYDWWLDGRIPQRSHNDYHCRPVDACLCLEVAMDAWMEWSADARTVFTNALFFHNRAPSYEWDWERFQAEYQVLDALYFVACKTKGVRARGHRDRIRALCDRFGLLWDPRLVDDVVGLRNSLIHEALWGGEMPGGGSSHFHKPLFLHRFNNRLGLAIAGISADYIGSNWHSLGQFHFAPRA